MIEKDDEKDAPNEDRKQEDKRPRVRMSAHLAASLGILFLGAISFFVALATTNWSASGQVLKIGIWDFCVAQEDNGDSWDCHPATADFSMAVQAFAILAAMCYACAFIIYVLFLVFTVLYKSRPLTIGMCLLVFSIVSLQIMTIIVYAFKNRQLYLKAEKEYFSQRLEELYLSWSFAFIVVSTVISTVAGVLLFVEFRNLTYEAVMTDEDG